MAVTGCTAAVDAFSGLGGPIYPIQKYSDGTITPHLAMSDFCAAVGTIGVNVGPSATDPGTTWKSNNHTAFLAFFAACKAQNLPGLIDGSYWDNAAINILGPIKLQGRTPRLDPTYNAAIMDGRIGNDGQVGGLPSSGVVLGSSASNPVVSHSVELYGLRFEIVGATVRGGSGGGKYNIWAANLTYAYFIDLVIHGGAQAGLIYSRGSKNTLTRGCSLCHVFADGFSYQVGVGNNHLNEQNAVHDTGDDFIPVVQGETSSSPLQQVTIRYNRCRLQQVTGSQVKTVGVTNIWIHHNSFEQGAGSAVRGGRDSTTGTSGSYNCLIENNLFGPPSYASGVASAVRMIGYAGVAIGDGVTGNGSDTTYVVNNNVFCQYDYRLIFLGQDNDAGPYTGLTFTNNRLMSREDAVNVNSAIYAACTNGLIFSGNTYTHIGQLYIFCSSSNVVTNGTMVFSNEVIDWNWANQATNDLFNFGTATSAAHDYTVQIDHITSTSPNVCDRWINNTGTVPWNVHYTMSTCTSSPDANDKTLHSLTDGVNGCVID